MKSETRKMRMTRFRRMKERETMDERVKMPFQNDLMILT
jgi:hypothetical protein